MVSAELLNLLCCPETRQPVRLADAQLLQRLNDKIAAGALRTRSGRQVTELLTEGLIRDDGKICYPVRNDIPVMLVDEGIPAE